MAVTMANVKGYLMADEPQYGLAARHLGPDAIPHLLQLVQGEDAELAAKAASLAGFLGADRAVEVIRVAANSDRRSVRVAAAASMGRLPTVPEDLAGSLLTDSDVGVRKWALNSIRGTGSSGLMERARQIAESDPEESLRQLASRVVSDTA